MSIVLELQAAAMNGSTDVSDLLRKAHLVAYKLSLESFEKWTNCELSGYLNKKMPPYRKVGGSLVAHNPYNGWIPLMFDDSEMMEQLTQRYLNMALSVVQETIVRGEPYGYVYFPTEVENHILSLMEFHFRPAMRIPRAAFISIVDEVRNVIFRWSLKLERDGILGEGMTFTPIERKAAHDKAKELRPEITINVSNIHVAKMDRSVIQQSSPSGGVYFDPE